MRSTTVSLTIKNLRDLAQEISIKHAQIALVFAPRQALEDQSVISTIKSHITCETVFVSTAGQISGVSVNDAAISFTFIQLEKSELATASLNMSGHQNERELGTALFKRLNRKDLAGIMVFADGTSINGSELKEGLEASNVNKAPITGGLAGDGSLFEKTLVGIDSVSQGEVAAIAFYGSDMEFGYGSRGGWLRGADINMVSSSDGNVLKEIEGVPALDFYKRKLNGKLNTLPADALKFPLNIHDPLTGQDLVRTVLSVDETTKTMTFAGDIPVLSNVQILSASTTDLIQGSKAAAIVTKKYTVEAEAAPDLAILISCVGRKLVLEDLTVAEVQAVRDELGPTTTLSGFYSYGELSPSDVSGRCELHNQTMTITTLRERGC